MSTSTRGNKYSSDDLNILNPAHPIAAGFSGTVDVLTNGGNVYAYGTPSSDATVVGELPTQGQQVLFAYESGANMIGLTAPARRVGFFLVDDYADNMTADGWAIFDATICWAIGSCGGQIPDCSQDPLSIASPTSGHNYIISRTPRVAVNSIDQILNNPSNYNARDLHEEIAYFDGIGRPLQTVNVAAAPDMSDIVSFHTYDANGREAESFLPFNAQGMLGSFRTDTDSDPNLPDELQNNFYQTLYPGEKAFAKTFFENSPLNRVIEQEAEGQAWMQKGSIAGNRESDEHTKLTYYLSYEEDKVPDPVKLPLFTADAGVGSTYTLFGKATNNDPSDILVIESRDEKNTSSYTFVDKRGRILMTTNKVSDGPSANSIDDDIYANNLYLYNEWDQLKFVIQAEGYELLMNGSTLTQEILDNWAFQYVYDGRRRLTEKKVPGGGWQYSIYNKIDQVVLTQNPVQRTKNEWSYTKYDPIGRSIETGLYEDSRNRSQIQAEIDALPLFEEAQAGNEGYSNQAFPIDPEREKLSITYYDHYNFDRIGTEDHNYEFETLSNTNAVDTDIKGMLAGMQTRVLESNTFLLSVSFYDEYGRELQIQSQHLHGTDTSSNQLNFAGEIEKTILRHAGPSNTSIISSKSFCYDHRGRIIRTMSQLNNDPEIVLSALEYDQLGRLKVKRLHDEDGQGNFLQDIDYAYNIRSWMTNINQVSPGLDYSLVNPDNDLFRMRLHYEEGFNISPTFPLSGPVNTGEFNGNIAGIEWQTGSETQVSAYVFAYDELNRLTQADFGKTDCQNTNQGVACLWNNNPTQNFSSSYSYDLVGNLKTLTRKGKTGTNSYGLMDDLLYFYKNGGKSNQLTSVFDNGFAGPIQAVDQFVDGNSIGEDYFYDENGNLIEDKNKGITISYNHLNKPTQIQFTIGRSIGFVYDATGTKLQQIVDQGNGSIQINDYINGFHYEANTLTFLTNEEGRCVPDGSLNEFRYEYKITDHLGNVRVMFSDLNHNGTINPDPNAAIPEILQSTDYYPFGQRMPIGNITSGITQNYLYNGKELQEEFGLNWYDYGARMYNPSLGRWGTLDPKAEILEKSSPYVYAFNSPFLFIDPNGELPILINGRAFKGGPFKPSVRANGRYWGDLVDAIREGGLANPSPSNGNPHYTSYVGLGQGVPARITNQTQDEFFFVDGDQYFDSHSGYDLRPRNKRGGFLTGNRPSDRRRAGTNQARADFQKILDRLERDPESGKIIEKIQIYTHSRGAVFSEGYVEELLRLISEKSEEFDDPANVIEYILHLNPHQSYTVNAIPGVPTYSIHHSGDILSGNRVSGSVTKFHSSQKGHSSSTFRSELKTFISAFYSTGGVTPALIYRFIKDMKEKYGIDIVVVR